MGVSDLTVTVDGTFFFTIHFLFDYFLELISVVNIKKNLKI